MICYQRVDAGPDRKKKNNPLWFPAKVNGLAGLQYRALSEAGFLAQDQNLLKMSNQCQLITICGVRATHLPMNQVNELSELEKFRTLPVRLKDTSI